MSRNGWIAGQLFVLAAALALVSCRGAAPVPRRVPSLATVPMAHTTGAGPAKGFRIAQELTSMADVLWEGELPGRGAIREKRESGLRLLVLFQVAERGENTAVINAELQKTEIPLGGTFVAAPFLQFNPPRVVTFKVNYGMRTVDFSAAERAYQAWFDGLRGTPAWEVMSSSFSARSWVAQLKDLLGRTALDFAGNTYAFGRAVNEKKEFFVPLLGPGISLGPIDVDLASSLRYVEVGKGRKIFRIRGDQRSNFLRFAATALASRMHAMGAQVPAVFESEGTLKGTVEAQVDAASGWTTEMYADFTSMASAGFEGGTLTETVKGYRIVITR